MVSAQQEGKASEQAEDTSHGQPQADLLIARQEPPTQKDDKEYLEVIESRYVRHEHALQRQEEQKNSECAPPRGAVSRAAPSGSLWYR